MTPEQQQMIERLTELENRVDETPAGYELSAARLALKEYMLTNYREVLALVREMQGEIEKGRDQRDRALCLIKWIEGAVDEENRGKYTAEEISANVHQFRNANEWSKDHD